jgi:gamma-glutamyl-gamma-aminobutyraldehyde dehydrogenase/4-guanidinobutyraldehyde dehydrogenase/NAD-dependent aldehyde dehydrogenase
MGAIVDATQLKTVMGYIESGNADGARCSRRQAGAHRDGRLLRRTDVVRSGGQRHDYRARRNLRAGAVGVELHRCAEAVRQANATSYGLHAAVWTSDMSKAIQTARALRAGTVHVNQYDGDDITVPFGGYKQSGNGRDKSLHAFDKYTELKTTWIQIG